MDQQSMYKIVKRAGGLLLLLLVFVGCYYLVRLSMLEEPLRNEEGIFAELVVNRPPGPCYHLFGRVEGENLYCYISHPAGLYELLRLGGWVWHPFLAYPIYLNDAVVIPRLRAFAASYQLVFGGLLLMTLYWSRSFPRFWSILLLFAAMLSPLAIKSSIHLQTDSTSGVIFCGLAALLFLLGVRWDLSAHSKGVLFFLGGVFAGAGKQEWSFALLLAMVLTAALRRAFKRKFSEEPVTAFYWIATGLLLSNLASYLFDPANYTLGLHYIKVFSKVTDVSKADWNLSHWLGLMQYRMPFLSVCVVFLAVSLYFLVAGRHLSPANCLVTSFGFFLMAGYILSDHNAQLRYFAPSLVVLTVALVMVLPVQLTRWDRRILLGVIFSVGFSTLVFLVGCGPDRNLFLEKINSGEYTLSPDTVLFITDGAVWNKPDIDYIGTNMDFEKNREWIYRQYGKQLVYPESVLKLE